MTVPIERAIDRNARTGLIEDLLQRVEVASSDRVSELRFSPRFRPGNVQLLPEDSDLIPVNLPHLVMKGMDLWKPCPVKPPRILPPVPGSRILR